MVLCVIGYIWPTGSRQDERLRSATRPILVVVAATISLLPLLYARVALSSGGRDNLGKLRILCALGMVSWMDGSDKVSDMNV